MRASLCAVSALFLTSLAMPAQNVGADSPTTPKLALDADLVLTPEFCATKKGLRLALAQTYVIGPTACEQLNSVLRATFLKVTRVDSVPKPDIGAARVTLIPKFADIMAVQASQLLYRPELVILVEWTVLDGRGKTIWVQTVQGSSRYKMGTWALPGKARKIMVEQAVEELTSASVHAISAASEIQRVAQTAMSPAQPDPAAKR
jgi:hypothetical protein